jgi:hypothetical protein
MGRLLAGVFACALVAAFSGGCVVHDRHPEDEPIWWPNGIVRESTLSSSNGKLNPQFPPYFYLPPVNPPGPQP